MSGVTIGKYHVGVLIPLVQNGFGRQLGLGRPGFLGARDLSAGPSEDCGLIIDVGRGNS